MLTCLCPDPELARLNDVKAEHKSSVENYEKKIRKARTDEERKMIPKYEKKLGEKRHLLRVSELRADAREMELPPRQNLKEAENLRRQADEAERAWKEKHARATTTPASNGSQVRQSGPQVVVRSPTMPSVGVPSAQVKKSSTSTASSHSRQS